MVSQYRNYILIINNEEKTDEQFFEYLINISDIKYFIFQREKGKEKETLHIQLYIEFDFGKRFELMKRLFPTAHIERRQGSKIQARDYCKNEDTRISEKYYEYGVFAEERERID